MTKFQFILCLKTGQKRLREIKNIYIKNSNKNKGVTKF